MTVTVVKNDDTVYVPIPVNNPSTAYKASLHVLLKHFADFHHTVLKVVSALGLKLSADVRDGAEVA